MKQPEIPDRPSPDASRTNRRVIAAISILAVLLLYRPYTGIIHDAKIYVGHALAVLSPDSIGRDFMFALDGQSEFSLFPPVITGAVGWLGPSSASILLTLAGLGLWLAGAWALMSRLARGPMLWAVLVCILVLPQSYGCCEVLGYGEAFVTPRPLAEAAVMGGLAALLDGRRLLGLAMLAGACAIHPIIALAGLGVGFVLLAAEDRRWLWAVPLGVVGLLAAVMLRLPLAERLSILIDADWLASLRRGKDYLFPDLWLPKDFVRIGLQVTAVLIAAALTEGRARVLLLAAAGIGLTGLAAAALFGDLIPNLLITQVQTWRTLWLLTLLGNAALPIAAIGLWRRGGAYRTALGTLAAAWLMVDVPLFAALLMVATLVLFGLARTGRLRPLPLGYARLLGGGLALLAVMWLALNVQGLAGFLAAGARAGAPVGWEHALATDLPRLPLAALAIALALMGPPRSRGVAVAAAAGAVALLVLAVGAWDQRTPIRRVTDERRGLETLARLLAKSPGEVLVLDGEDTQAWLLADRPNWVMPTQGAGVVFSRRLHEVWSGRMQTLVSLGVQDETTLAPFKTLGRKPAPSMRSASAIAALCRRPDGPAAVILPAPSPSGLPAGLWRPRAPSYVFYQDHGPAWRRIDSYAVVSCAEVRALRSWPAS